MSFAEHNNRIAYLELQRTLGMATADELRELRGALRLVGEGVPMVMPAIQPTVDEWLQSVSEAEAAEAERRAKIGAVTAPAQQIPAKPESGLLVRPSPKPKRK